MVLRPKFRQSVIVARDRSWIEQIALNAWLSIVDVVFNSHKACMQHIYEAYIMDIELAIIVTVADCSY